MKTDGREREDGVRMTARGHKGALGDENILLHLNCGASFTDFIFIYA